MDTPIPHSHAQKFGWPERSFDGLPAASAAQIIAQGTDIALVVDGDGIIEDVAFGDQEIAQWGFESWVGSRWVDTVTAESRPKVEDMLGAAASDVPPRWRQVNHTAPEGGDLPVRYIALGAGASGRVIAVGRQLRAIAAMQQRLVEAQQATERDYERYRHIETRYRILFQTTTEPILIVNEADLTISDINPAALRLIGAPLNRLEGRSVFDVFDKADMAAIQATLGEARAARRVDNVTVRLEKSQEKCRLSVSLFRQQRDSSYLMRLERAHPNNVTVLRPSGGSRFDQIMEALPDGLVVADNDLRIVFANGAFLNMAQLATLEHARGQPLDQFIGRTGVDMTVLAANVREHGSVRSFTTLLRGQFGSVEDIEVSGVIVPEGGEASFGFSVRSRAGRAGETIRGTSSASGAVALPQSPEQFTDLVGRMSLKDIVRETTDLIERLCIEAALELTGDNRASAAEVLGLSRQSLYAKLNRFGLSSRSLNEDG